MLNLKKSKKFKILAFIGTILLSVGMMTSCKYLDLDYEKGSLVVRNESGKTNMDITSVFVAAKGESGFTLVFTGAIKNDKAQFIRLNPGSYRVQVGVTTTDPDTNVSTTKYYQTGHNDYRKLDKDDFLTVVFDYDAGWGIHFD